MTSRSSSIRAATHAGSWYEAKANVLRDQLSSWLSNAQSKDTITRAIIAPHAGYSYSGPTAAWSYINMQPERIKRVFILGPSHHHYTRSCQLPTFKTYATPLGDLTIDAAVVKQLRDTGSFEDMSANVDEDEHSIEMHLPYIAHRMENAKFTIVPILVGALTTSSEQKFGQLLAPHLQDPHNFFVISSDFCHWGSRFSYTLYQKEHGEIWQSIDWLDHEGIKTIESGVPSQFTAYLKQYSNTICGRHPIAVLMNAVDTLAATLPLHIRFVQYAQSSKCKKSSDSSVSYASAIVFESDDKTNLAQTKENGEK